MYSRKPTYLTSPVHSRDSAALHTKPIAIAAENYIKKDIKQLMAESRVSVMENEVEQWHRDLEKTPNTE